MSRGGNVQGGAHLHDQNYLVQKRKSKNIVQNKKNGHKNPNNSHNDRDEIEIYQEINKRSRKWHSTVEQRTPK